MICKYFVSYFDAHNAFSIIFVKFYLGPRLGLNHCGQLLIQHFWHEIAADFVFISMLHRFSGTACKREGPQAAEMTRKLS